MEGLAVLGQRLDDCGETCGSMIEYRWYSINTAQLYKLMIFKNTTAEGSGDYFRNGLKSLFFEWLSSSSKLINA